MVSSPRKPAPAAGFTQTWNDTDAAFLDPASLPIARLPRGWERKQETKVTSNGKQKKVWRRYTTRARGVDADADVDGEEDEEEEHDSRARAVKKLQRMSPEAMEKSVSTRRGAKRAFKATRWDRRKSVLPRKKQSAEEPVAGAPVDSSESDTEPQVPENNTSSSLELGSPRNEELVLVSELTAEDQELHGTLTFALDEEHSSVGDGGAAILPTVQDVAIDAPEPSIEEDACLPMVFRSPARNTQVSLIENDRTDNDVEYPELIATPQARNATLHEVQEQYEDKEADEIPVNCISSTEMEAAGSREPQSAVPEEDEGVAACEELAVEETTAQEEEVLYPTLPKPASPQMQVEGPCLPQELVLPHTDMDSDISESLDETETDLNFQDRDGSPDEELTEASLQLNIQKELELEMQREHTEKLAPSLSPDQAMDGHAESISLESFNGDIDSVYEEDSVQDNEIPAPIAPKTENEDIAAGLILEFFPPAPREPTHRRLRSPSPPPVEHGPDDATMTIALDDDTAILKDFLSRAAANKASKTLSTARRESLQNRRDSDVVRHALASPRKVLEDKDPNSPSKLDNDVTLELSQTLTLAPNLQTPASPTPAEADIESVEHSKSSRSRRSSRTRKSRLPAPASLQPTAPPKIAVRRADGGDPIVLKKTDAQELSLLTRANTRKNKQGAVAVNVRLLKLTTEAAGRSEDSTVESVQVPGKKYVRWDEQLAYYQEGTDTLANMLANAESMATPDELSMPAPTLTPRVKVKPKVEKDRSSTPKVRRVRGLGTANGTPGKGLLQPGMLLPDAIQAEQEAAQTKPPTSRLAKPKASKVKKMTVASTSSSSSSGTSVTLLTAPDTKVPALDIAPVGIETDEPTKERKSRLATPRKVKLPQLATTVPVDGKENQQRIGLAAATPKKRIPVPSVVIPAPAVSGVEPGLPRRRARKL